MILETITKKAVEYVLENLRPEDREERNASMTVAEQVHGFDVLMQSPLAHTLYQNEEPVAVYGVIGNGLGVGSAWMWTTAKFTGDMLVRQTVVDVQKMIREFFEEGNHRLQVLTMESHKNSSRFLEMVGFEKEAVLRVFGAEQQDFVMYSIVRKEQ